MYNFNLQLKNIELLKNNLHDLDLEYKDIDYIEKQKKWEDHVDQEMNEEYEQEYLLEECNEELRMNLYERKVGKTVNIVENIRKILKQKKMKQNKKNNNNNKGDDEE